MPDGHHKMVVAEEIGLAIAFVLVLIGIGATNFAPRQGYSYWIWLSVLIAAAGTFMGGLQARRRSRNWRQIVRLLGAQLAHWAAVLVTILCVFLLLNAGRLNYESTGLVIALILGLATFLDGFHRVGWRFALLGALILLTTVIAGYVEAYVWPLLLIVGLSWLLAFFWERRRRSGPALHQGK